MLWVVRINVGSLFVVPDLLNKSGKPLCGLSNWLQNMYTHFESYAFHTHTPRWLLCFVLHSDFLLFIIIILRFSSFVISFGLQSPIFSFFRPFQVFFPFELYEMISYGIIAFKNISNVKQHASQSRTFYINFVWIYVNASCGYEAIMCVFVCCMNISGA